MTEYEILLRPKSLALSMAVLGGMEQSESQASSENMSVQQINLNWRNIEVT
jgi:hypothetical protein